MITATAGIVVVMMTRQDAASTLTAGRYEEDIFEAI
jgi:hypothetical protein